jgi:hypothetical protein
MADQEAIAMLENLQTQKYGQLAGKTGKLTVGLQLGVPGLARKIGVAALLDSGYDGSSIDHHFVKRNNIPMRKVANPVQVLNADGVENKHGYITNYVTLQVQIDKHSEKLDFAVTQLNTTNIYLGLEWLKWHNPFVNWRTGHMEFNNCLRECQRHPMRTAKVDEVRIDGLSHDQEHFKAIMNMQAQMEKTKYFYKPIKTGTFEEVVPKHYHNFKDVFGEEEFQALPEQ